MADDEQVVEISRAVLCAVFDAAIGSMDFGSGFLDDEEVRALRACAVVLGADPMTATPSNFRCKYSGSHTWVSRRYADLAYAKRTWARADTCLDCRAERSWAEAESEIALGTGADRG